MRTLLAITAGAVATAALMVLCEARPGQPPMANAASTLQASAAGSRHWSDDDADSALTCDCAASAEGRFELGCFLWCPLDFDDASALDDE